MVIPRSPAKRNTPTAVPDDPSAATSPSIAVGMTALDPVAVPTAPITRKKIARLGLKPIREMMTTSHANVEIATGLRPRRSANAPAGYITTISVTSATASTAPIVSGDMPSR